MAKATPGILSTKEYAIFKLMSGNRKVDYNHVKRLKRSMQEEPELFATNPIQVNEHGFIIDGQHRRLAAQELDVPVYYIVVEGGTLDETRVLNVTQRRWSLLDFARSYADSGHGDYRTFLRYVNQYPKIAPGILRTCLAGGRKHDLEVDFRRGEFVIEDEQKTRVYVDRLNEVINRTHVRMSAPMANALFSLFKDSEEFDFDLFINKLDRESARELFRPAPSIRACLRSIEDVYNFQSKNQKRLY